MQVGALFAYPSAQCTGRFFAVVRTLLPVRIAELLFCVPKCAPKRQVRALTDANGSVCVLKCARSSFRRALRNVDGLSTSDACHVDHLMMGDEVGQGTMGS